MSNHITEWLNAYLDGELRGGQLHQVEAHLSECRECRGELQSLQSLSNLLHEAPAPKFISSERFASQVGLRLPHVQPKALKPKAQEVGWWMIPVSLLILWVFISSYAQVREVVSTANSFGLLCGASTWLAPGSSSGAFWSGELGDIGLLRGNNLKWAELTETFTRNRLPEIVWQASIALMYVSWIAIWWLRYTPREHGQTLET